MERNDKSIFQSNFLFILIISSILIGIILAIFGFYKLYNLPFTNMEEVASEQKVFPIHAIYYTNIYNNIEEEVVEEESDEDLEEEEKVTKKDVPNYWLEFIMDDGTVLNLTTDIIYVDETYNDTISFNVTINQDISRLPNKMIVKKSNPYKMDRIEDYKWKIENGYYRVEISKDTFNSMSINDAQENRG